MKQERNREKIRKILEKRVAREAAGLLPSDGRREVSYINVNKSSTVLKAIYERIQAFLVKSNTLPK